MYSWIINQIFFETLQSAAIPPWSSFSIAPRASRSWRQASCCELTHSPARSCRRFSRLPEQAACSAMPRILDSCGRDGLTKTRIGLRSAPGGRACSVSRPCWLPRATAGQNLAWQELRRERPDGGRRRSSASAIPPSTTRTAWRSPARRRSSAAGR